MQACACVWKEGAITLVGQVDFDLSKHLLLDAPILLELLHGLQDHALLGVLGKLVDEIVRCGRGHSFERGRRASPVA